MESKKTFVFVNNHPDLQSGGNIYNAHIIVHLEKSGHTVFQTRDRYAKDFIKKQYIILLDSIILDESFDTHAFNGEQAYFLIHLWPSHNVDLQEERRKKLIEKQREVCQKFHLVFAGEHSLHQCQTFYGDVLRNIFIIPPGVAAGWKVKKKYPNTASNFLMIGNICRRKRQLDVVNLFAKSQFSIHLHLVGRSDESTYSHEIFEIIHSFPNKIIWHKEVEFHQMNEFMLDFDAVILFSEEENNSIALLESIASGIPLITTPTGNYLAFKKQQVGYVLDSFEMEELSKAVIQMHTDPVFYRQQCEAVKRCQVNTWEESSNLFLDL
jgi:glycosyltransferase involved in cell wall biosynthesis